jgi:proteasome lid subunit RPN8/RPN11
MASPSNRNPNGGAEKTPPPAQATEKIVVKDSGSGPKPVQRKFPGPKGADAALRVAIDARAYVDLVAHAKETLDVEVCGVLIGQVCEDDQGVFVHVEGMIRGAAASEGSTHVTFTQTTWNTIHQVLERAYPKLKIVGWYHTHPGFGVEFSEMDLFIQNNFFSGPTQIALVTDPLSGAVAILVNTSQGARYLPRCWVDGREQSCQVPTRGSAQAAAAATADGPAAAPGDQSEALRNLEARVGQLIQAHDDLRSSYHSFLMFCGIVFCLTLIVSAGYFIYSQKVSRLEPPRINQVVPVPVQVGDKAVILGVGITAWEVPPELNALWLQMELLKKKEAEEAAKKTGSNAPPAAAATNNVPPAKPD